MVSYNLGNSPWWYLADLSGKPLINGFLWSYKNITPNVFKPIYSDPAGTAPYPNPIPITGNGFANLVSNLYFANDEPYKLVVTDSAVNNGGTILYESIYNAAGSGSGGGSVTIYSNLTNLITNGQFIFNNSPNTVTPITTAVTTIAPSNHSGLTTPDIVIRKNSTASTESYRFVPFNQGDTAVTQSPRFYLEYACTVIGGEIQKDIEFPISAHSRTLEGNLITFSFWGRSSSSSSIEVFVTQYFGDGSNSPSAPATSDPQSGTLTGTWTRYNFNITVPLTNGKTIGNCGNDYFVATIRAPLSQVFNLNFTNMTFLDGTFNADYPYTIQDYTDTVVNSARTGDVKQGFNNSVFNAFGWVKMDDGTIGSASSTATTRANIDTFPLYKLLWENVSQPSANAWCAVVGGLGSDAVSDFTANKPLTLSRTMGCALAGVGTGAGLTTRVLGEFFGEENHVITASESATLNYTGSTAIVPLGDSSSGSLRGIFSGLVANIASFVIPANIVSNAGNQGHNTMQPTTFMNFYIKL
jgi:hypothetical protein